MYITYLGLHYPEYVIEEIADLEDLTSLLVCLDAAHARDWFAENDKVVMESDIWIKDEDAILKIINHQRYDPNWNFEGDFTETSLYYHSFVASIYPKFAYQYISGMIILENGEQNKLLVNRRLPLFIFIVNQLLHLL